MWRTFFLTFYILPNLYIFFRIHKLFSGFRYKNIILLFYVLLILIFPVIEILAHNSHYAWVKYLITIGYYSLPYLLYLFLTLIVFDVLLVLNSLLKIVSKETMQDRSFRMIRFWAIFGLPLVIVILGTIHYKTIQVKEYHIQIPRRSATVAHLRMAVAADFHLREQTSRKFMPQFIAKINTLNADIVLLPGDLLEGDRRDENTRMFEQQFRQIKSKYGVYAAFGNHEYHGGTRQMNFFQNAHIQVLQDAAVMIDQAFYLIGRNDDHAQKRKCLDELLKLTTADLPIIVLDHRPLNLADVGRSKVDIQVSSHTHNGQLFPLNFITRSIYELSWGHTKIGNTDFFVTSGIQTWGPPVRTAGNSEIMLIEVEFK